MAIVQPLSIDWNYSPPDTLQATTMLTQGDISTTSDINMYEK